MGGFVLPFMERLGIDVAPWDFRVPGVTSISADLHKLGYAPKGASVILHRSKELRRHQTFVFDGWLGGLYASPAMQGTRPALPMACAWAVLHRLGMDGYLRLTRVTLEAAWRIRAGVGSIEGVSVVGRPDAHMHAIAGDGGVDPFAVGDALAERGWYHDKQGPPPSLHATVSAGNAPVVEEYLADLAAAVAEVRRSGGAGEAGGYATLE